MKIQFIKLLLILSLTPSSVNAQMVVADPANLAQGIINTAVQIVETSATASNVINNFKETIKIYEQGKEFYDALKSVNTIIKDAKKVQKTVLLVGEISEIYVSSFQKILSDPNYTPEELNAIGFGYAKLLQDSTEMLQELKDVVSTNGLSMSDSERITLINSTYEAIKKQRDLVSYYTRKNISVSYLRSKKTGDLDRVIKLYGNQNDKYW